MLNPCSLTSMKGRTMKPIHFLFAMTIGLTGSAFAAGGHDHAHEHAALHGGIVVEAKDMDFELVAKPDSIALYIADHGKPVKVKGVDALVMLLSATMASPPLE